MPPYGNAPCHCVQETVHKKSKTTLVTIKCVCVSGHEALAQPEGTTQPAAGAPRQVGLVCCRAVGKTKPRVSSTVGHAQIPLLIMRTLGTKALTPVSKS